MQKFNLRGECDASTMSRPVDMVVAVPRLGVVKMRFDLDSPADRECMALNRAPPYAVLSIAPVVKT